MIKILITDDHPVVRSGLRQILEDTDEIEFIHEAASGKEMIERLKTCRYDVILLDVSLPGQSGLDLIGRIKSIQPAASVLMLSIHSEEIFALKAIKSGASGYVTKSSNPDELIKAVFKTAKGEKYISSPLAGILKEEINSGKSLHSRTRLTIREMQVLMLFAEGKTVVQIASELFLSPKTISTYRKRLLNKLHLNTTSDLVKYAVVEELKKKK